MVRRLLSGGHNGNKGHIEKRNYEIQRIETFSDGVFAFAVTLLIVSLEVPKSFEELMVTMRGFFAFGISFTLLVMIWNEQHRFFRHYGLDDVRTVFLNGALLFIVLFYVYPLKFLFTLIQDELYDKNQSRITITQDEVPSLMIIYAIGYIAIYGLFFLMYQHANSKSKELELSPIEKFDCKTSMYKVSIMVFTGIASLLVSLLLSNSQAGNAGFVYILLAPALTIFFTVRNRKRKKLFPEFPRA